MIKSLAGCLHIKK